MFMSRFSAIPFLMLSSFFLPGQAKADVIRCTFTEPFLSTVYSMAQQSLTVTGPDARGNEKVLAVIPRVSFQILSTGEYQLLDSRLRIVQKFALSFDGTDGMSDRKYPYEVEWLRNHPSRNPLYGGCESNFLKAAIPGATAFNGPIRAPIE